MIVDCHAHVAREMTGFWEPLEYGKVLDRGETKQWFPASFHPVASPPRALLGYMDDAGVERAFLVQHHMYGDQNETVLECLREWPDRFVGFAYLGGMAQPSAADDLERLIAAGMAGLKVELNSTRRLNPDFRFDGEREARVWERLNQLRRPLVLDVNGASVEDTAALRRAIATMPNVQTVICHVGGPTQGNWQERALLAKDAAGRGWIDLAALPLMIDRDEEYPFPKAQEYVRWAVDTFGADRVMWGTDYPPALTRATYRQLLDMVRRHCNFLSDAQRIDLVGGTAERFLKASGLA